MPRAIGANCRVRMAVETTYGTPPASGWRNMPFAGRVTLGGERPLLDTPVLGAGAGRDAGAPFIDVLTVNGEIELPVDLIHTGHWLRLLFGPPTTTGTSPNFVHTFGSGAATLPSNSIEVAYPDVPSFEMCSGVRADTLEIDFSPSGAATMTIGLMAQGATRSATSGAGTPATATLTNFSKAQGSISRNSTPLAQVTGARLTYSNGLEAVRTIRSDLRIEGVDPGMCSATGEVTVRFENTTLLTQASDGTSCELALAYTINANRSLTITLHEVYFSLAKTPIEGPNGVSASFTFRAAFNATAGRMATVVLRNDQAASVYA